MDEPTSSLDAESEAVILQSMETVFRGMTSSWLGKGCTGTSAGGSCWASTAFSP
jgi:ABC-type transport system involved in cytochrome bd biosynthesis fused ATPase/permease subunit